jgi:predicted TIM-barrel fold metal-dependent hydrolase
MAEPTTRFEVIDSDGHVIEPDTVWSEYADPEFREVLAAEGGGAVQAIGIRRAYPDMPADFVGGGPGGDAESWEEVAERTDWDEESKYKMSRPGGHDPRARLVDMDADGIDVAVLYPTAMLTWVEELDVFGAACRAYNRWIADYCSAAPDRLYPVALVPLQDPDAAVAEMRRAVADHGAKGVMVRPAAYLAGRKLHDPVYDPFWAAAAELDCPIGVHPSPHGDMENSCRRLGLADGVVNPTEGLALRQGITNAFDLQLAVASFVLGGVCERHPQLRVAFLEGTGGWIVPMLQRFDHQFEIFGSSDQTTLPSELFARQCMISFDPDEVALAFTAEHLGADKILWASDYPHPDAKIPGVVDELMDAVKPLPEEAQRQIVGATARTFYKL